MDMRTWTLRSYGLWEMREKLGRAGGEWQESKSVPAPCVVEKEAHEEAGMTGKEAWKSAKVRSAAHR